MPIPMNYFNVPPPPSNHVRMVCYTRKTLIPRGGNRGPGHGRAARALARCGFLSKRAGQFGMGTWRGSHPEGRSHRHVVSSDPFSPRHFISRCRRGRSALLPEPGDLPDHLIGRTEKNFIVYKGFPSPPVNRSAPHSRTKCAPWGTPAVGQTGGTTQGGAPLRRSVTEAGVLRRRGEHGRVRIDNAGGNRRECLPARRWGSSSAGRAPRSQRGGRGFNPLLLHHLSY
jgi:hypothetical protein